VRTRRETGYRVEHTSHVVVRQGLLPQKERAFRKGGNEAGLQPRECRVALMKFQVSLGEESLLHKPLGDLRGHRVDHFQI